jgi:hypothetical protein
MIFEPDSNFIASKKFFRWYFIALVVFLFFLLAWLWVSIFYFQKNLLGIWSFTLADAPWMPPPLPALPIFAGHFFGDFQLPIAFSRLLNPYDPTFLFGAGLPITYFLFKIFTLVPLVLSFILFLTTGLSLFFYSNFFLLRNFGDYQIRFILTFAISFLNLPILIAIDRGNFIIFALALLVLSIYFGLLGSLNKSGPSVHLAALLFMLAASMKLYFIAFLIPIWLCKARLFVYLSIFYFLIGNFISALFIKLDVIYIYESVKNSLLYQTGSSDVTWLMSGVGLPSLFSNIYSIVFDIEKSATWLTSLGWIIFLPNLTWFLLVCGFCLVKNLALDLKIIWILSLTQFAPPVAMAYNLMWCVPSLVLLLRFMVSAKSENVMSLMSAKTLIIVSTFSLLPIPSVYWRLISPGLWVVAVLFQIFFIRYYSSRTTRVTI